MNKMAYRKFVLPGPENISMSAQEAQKLIECGNGDAALLYIYILKNRGNLSVAEAAYNLKRTPADIERSMLVLAGIGLVKSDDGFLPNEAPPAKEELPEYTAAEIKNELEQGAALDRKSVV